MVQTYGLTHINLVVRDLERALRFYEQVFGLRERALAIRSICARRVGPRRARKKESK